MDDVIFSGTNTRPARNIGGSDDLPRQQRAQGAGRVQRQRPDRDHAPHRARGGLGLSHQRPRGAGPRRQDPVRGRRDRRPLAGAGAPGPDRRDRQRQARAAPPHPRGRRRHRRAAQPPPRGRAAPEGDGSQPRAPQRRAGPAQQPGREPEAAGARRRGATRRSPTRSAARTRCCCTSRWTDAQAHVDGEEGNLRDALSTLADGHAKRNRRRSPRRRASPSAWTRCARRRPSAPPSSAGCASSRRTSSGRPRAPPSASASCAPAPSSSAATRRARKR